MKEILRYLLIIVTMDHYNLFYPNDFLFLGKRHPFCHSFNYRDPYRKVKSIKRKNSRLKHINNIKNIKAKKIQKMWTRYRINKSANIIIRCFRRYLFIKKLNNILSRKKHVNKLHDKISDVIVKFNTRQKENYNQKKNVLETEENIMKVILELDEISSSNELVRSKKKQVIRYANSNLDLLDQFK